MPLPDLSALLNAKAQLRKVETPKKDIEAKSTSVFPSSCDENAIRKVTGLKDDGRARVDYYLESGVDAWIDELKTNLEKNKAEDVAKSEARNGDGTTWSTSPWSMIKSIDDVTFPTTLVEFSRKEKLAIHGLYKEIFGDMLTTHGDIKTDQLSTIEDRVKEMEDRLRSETEEVQRLSSLEANLDEVVRQKHQSSAFVKLTTRSPKDSYWAVLKEKERFDQLQLKEQENRRSQGSEETGIVDHNALWISFSEQLRLAQKISTGKEALLLLCTSQRIYEDLDTD